MRHVTGNESPLQTSVTDNARPRLPAGVIQRSRLVDALDASVRRTVTLVCAGAGWGKTTLVASWSGVRSGSGPIAWLTAGCEHNRPEVFWSDLITALTTAGAVLPGSRPPVGDRDFLRWISLALAGLPATLVVVLDDVHKLTDRRVLDGLGALLRRAPERLRFVLSGRQEPDLSLHLLRVAGQLTEIRSGDLAFRVEEAADLLAVQQRRMPVETMAELVRTVEGWPVGVRLALDMPVGPLAEQIAETFLAEEVLAGQPERIRRFLLRTSVPDRICGALADALTGEQDGQRTLELLSRANLFVEPVGAGGWFRYHRTFRSALRHRLGSVHPDAVPDLHLRAARWHAAAGAVLPALTHAAAASDWSLVADLVVERGMPLFTSGDRAELIEVLHRIPPARLAESPELAMCAAVLAFDRGDVVAMAGRIADARAMRGRAERGTMTATDVALGVMESVILVRWRGDMARLLDSSTDLLSRMAVVDTKRGSALPQYRTVVLNNKAVALLWSGQLDHADRYLWAAASGARGSGMPLVAASSLGHLALLDFLRGSVHEAENNLTAAADIGRRIDAQSRSGLTAAYLARALVESERGRDIEAGEALRKALHAGGEVPEATHVVLTAIVRARLLVDRGESLNARTVVRQAWDEAGPSVVAPLLMRLTDILESEIDLALGDAAAVVARYDDGRSLSPGEQVCLARAHLMAGRLGPAESLLGRVRAGSDRVSAVTACVLAALIADLRGRGIPAGEALHHALMLAEPDSIRRPFRLCDPQRLHTLAGRQQWLTEPRGHAGESALAEITGELPAVAPSAGPLSERELDVLQYLPTMLTAGEIAENLNISINTVKAHMRAIYRKLGAGRRREAVTAARHLGLM